jgi:hypothetical protein
MTSSDPDKKIPFFRDHEVFQPLHKPARLKAAGGRLILDLVLNNVGIMYVI